MRVSTAQFYFQNSQQLSNKESSLNDQVKYLSSGKRVLTAKDDAVQFSKLAGYKDQLELIDKYQRNIVQTQNRNNLQEVSFSQAEDVMQEVKQFFIQANNGSIGNVERSAIAKQISYKLEQMLDLANTKDENGAFIYAGYQTDNQPFTLQPDESVVYSGDSGKHELEISRNMRVATNQPGDAAFLDVPNQVGDFSAIYQTNSTGFSLNRAVISDPSVYNTTVSPPDYRFDFTDTTADGVANEVTVTDSGGGVILTVDPYVSGQALSFNGVEVQFNGTPAPGDQVDITPQETVSIFETLRRAIDWVQAPANTAVSKAEYNDILTDVSGALNHMSAQRAEIGIRLQLISSQENKHADTSLYLSQSQASIEDLDFAKAISEFEQAQTALQVSQQVFVQTKDLSLFSLI